jgi:hypothetical protein
MRSSPGHLQRVRRGSGHSYQWIRNEELSFLFIHPILLLRQLSLPIVLDVLNLLADAKGRTQELADSIVG